MQQVATRMFGFTSMFTDMHLWRLINLAANAVGSPFRDIGAIHL